MQRNQAITSLKDTKLDVLIVGGGIVGAGIARDAAMRGLRTGLVEQNDFASGTSSRSSRLLHGGIRYLAQGRVGLVREASREKTVINRIAPHLSDPLPFIFPTRKKSGWSRWKLGPGVKIYDFLCGKGNLGKSSSMNARQTLELLPGLATDRLTGSVRYYDGLTNDARLVIDTLLSASEHGGTILNYLRYEGAEKTEDGWKCTLQDTQTGEHFDVLTKIIVNATGPWSDRIPLAKTSLRLTKGVHIVIEKERLPIPDAVVMAEGQRILFAIPWGERVILGTTDTDYDGPLDAPTCDAEDTQYVLDVTNEAFPGSNLTEKDVISGWAGLRPLVADKNGNPSDISRRHDITMSHPGWWDVAGGKLTTYRLMAEETVDAIARFLGDGTTTGKEATACKTASEPLLSNGSTSIVSGILPPEVSQEVVQECCRAEWTTHLEDLMIRRTSWRYYHRDHVAIAERAVRWMAECLAWDDEKIHEELSHYKQLVGATSQVPAPHSFADRKTTHSNGAAQTPSPHLPVNDTTKANVPEADVSALRAK